MVLYLILLERQLIQDYEQTIEELLRGLSDNNHSIATEIAKLPEHIRGFDLVKHRNVEKIKKREKELLDKFRKYSGFASITRKTETVT